MLTISHRLEQEQASGGKLSPWKVALSSISIKPSVQLSGAWEYEWKYGRAKPPIGSFSFLCCCLFVALEPPDSHSIKGSAGSNCGRLLHYFLHLKATYRTPDYQQAWLDVCAMWTHTHRARSLYWPVFSASNQSGWQNNLIGTSIQTTARHKKPEPIGSDRIGQPRAPMAPSATIGRLTSLLSLVKLSNQNKPNWDQDVQWIFGPRANWSGWLWFENRVRDTRFLGSLHKKRAIRASTECDRKLIRPLCSLIMFMFVCRVSHEIQTRRDAGQTVDWPHLLMDAKASLAWMVFIRARLQTTRKWPAIPLLLSRRAPAELSFTPSEESPHLTRFVELSLSFSAA